MTVPPDINYDETYTRATSESLAAKTKLDGTLSQNVVFDRTHWADDIRFSRDIWCLKFQYKPIRTIWVDVPTKNGVERKLVLYMIYSVTNAGKESVMASKIARQIEFPEMKKVDVPACTCEFCVKDDGNTPGNTPGTKPIIINAPPLLRNQSGEFKPEPIEMPIEFAPQFLLASDRILESAKTEVDPKTGDITTDVRRTNAIFSDRLIPVAIDKISEREKMDKPLESTVSIAGKTIKPNETVWGVVTWVDVDPRINFFSIYVSGLTNAYRLERKDEDQYVFPKGSPYEAERGWFQKVLKLNFSRPGDSFDMNEKQIRIGIQGEPDHQWDYLYVGGGT